MTRIVHGVAGVAVAVLLLPVLAWASPTTMRHSGIVVDIDEAAETFVLAEVGPWQTEHGRTLITYLTIEVPAGVPLVLVERAAAAPSGFPGDFVESDIGAFGLIRGDAVTIDCQHEGRRLIARRITVATPDEP